LKEIEVATLAGFFAGEGNISISSGKWHTLYTALGNTEKMWVDKFYEAFGGSRYTEKPKYHGAKYVFRWRVNGKKARRFLEIIQPYLIGEKAEQLKIALQLQQLKDSVDNPNLGYAKDVQLQMDGLSNSLKELRRTAAETNRKDAAPGRSDSPTLEEIPVS
jgi:hypothetical protein